MTFGVGLGPLINPDFNLCLFHELLGVQVVWAKCDWQIAFAIQPCAKVLELGVAAQRLEFGDVELDLLRCLGLLHLFHFRNQCGGRFIQNIRCRGGGHGYDYLLDT